MPGLGAGGAEKALINLLLLLKSSNYKIDLLLFSNEGIFTNQVPDDVNIINPEGNYKIFRQPLLKSLLCFFVRFNIKLLLSRFLYFKINRNKNRSQGINEQYSWNVLKKSIEPLSDKYDIAIGFLEKTSIYYIVDKVQAKSKIGWIHNDYAKLDLDTEWDRKYFKHLNHIVTVSEKCVLSLFDYFPEYSNKIKCIYNITSKTLVQQLADINENVLDVEKFNLVSIGRLDFQKGFDLGLDALSLLPKDILTNIKLTIIGEGPERNSLENRIKQLELHDSVQLLGLTSNPYVWIKHATIYFQPSRFEGKSIAIDEAKLLAKPILVTNFETVYDQIEHLRTGYIVDKTPQAIADGIIELLQNEKLRDTLESNLKDFSINELEILNQLKSLINA